MVQSIIHLQVWTFVHIDRAECASALTRSAFHSMICLAGMWFSAITCSRIITDECWRLNDPIQVIAETLLIMRKRARPTRLGRYATLCGVDYIRQRQAIFRFLYNSVR